MMKIILSALALFALSTAADAGTPTVSIIIPTNSRPEFLRQAIRSIARQDYPLASLLDVVVVDDSLPHLQLPDDELPALQDLLLVDGVGPELVYMRLPEMTSIGAKRNIAVDEANGEYIVHWDDDDFFSPQRVSIQLASVAEGLADITLLKHKASYFFDDNKLRVGDWGPSYATLVYPKAAWEKFHFPDASIAEDLEFVTRASHDLGYVVRQIENAPTNTFVYVRHGANAWQWNEKEHPVWMNGGELRNVEEELDEFDLAFRKEVLPKLADGVLAARRVAQPKVGTEQVADCSMKSALFRLDKRETERAAKRAEAPADPAVQIEKVYYINLKEDTERKQVMEQQLESAGLAFERFDAVRLEKLEDLLEPRYRPALMRGLLKDYFVPSKEVRSNFRASFETELAEGASKLVSDMYEHIPCQRRNALSLRSREGDCAPTVRSALAGEARGHFYDVAELSEMQLRWLLQKSATKYHYNLAELSVTLSHELLLAKIQEDFPEGAPGVALVLEDDAVVPADLQTRLDRVMKMVPTDFDSVRLGWFGGSRVDDEINQCVYHPEAGDVKQERFSDGGWNGYYFGSHAYVVSLDSMKASAAHMMSHIEEQPLSNAIDLQLTSTADGMRHYVLKYPLIHQRPCDAWKSSPCVHHEAKTPYGIAYSTGWLNYCIGDDNAQAPVPDCLDYTWVHYSATGQPSPEFSKHYNQRSRRLTTDPQAGWIYQGIYQGTQSDSAPHSYMPAYQACMDWKNDSTNSAEALFNVGCETHYDPVYLGAYQGGVSTTTNTYVPWYSDGTFSWDP